MPSAAGQYGLESEDRALPSSSGEDIICSLPCMLPSDATASGLVNPRSANAVRPIQTWSIQLRARIRSHSPGLTPPTGDRLWKDFLVS